MISSSKSKTPAKKSTLSVAHSPDPDDAFMFYGISQAGLAGQGYRIRHVLKDIESLNRDAMKGRWHVTAISAAAYPFVADKYRILSVGASIGRRYGPLLVTTPAKRGLFASKDWKGIKVATPGPRTTALLLARLAHPGFTAVNTPFDKVFDALSSGKVDAALVIHEGQLTYKTKGFVLLDDLGKWWFRETRLPIPLGLDVVRRDMGAPAARWMARLLVDSIRTAYRDDKNAVAYALAFGRGIDAKIGRRFVRMYVNKDTLDMGREGAKALAMLFRLAHRQGLLPKPVPLDIVRP